MYKRRKFHPHISNLLINFLSFMEILSITLQLPKIGGSLKLENLISSWTEHIIVFELKEKFIIFKRLLYKNNL